ncbi:MAG: hypothetical protein O3B13_17360 [Planctomycetota bacterium]|nr:hypothetical protein [Planctomycetota bacterium]
MTVTFQPAASIYRVAGFVCLHMAVLASGVAWATIRYREFQGERALPELRTEPLSVRPLYDDPEVISDSDLRIVLEKLRPEFRGPSPKTNHIDHSLRMWRPEATFDDDRFLSGIEMREFLLDHRRFSLAWGDKQPPLLIPSETGTIVRVQQGPASSSHRDHTLATMAETGTPLDYPVITASGEVPLSSLLERTLNSFSLNQVEYEWSTLAFACYVPTLSGWYSSEGQHITFDRLADRLMRERRHRGVCRGNHRIYSLVILLRINEQTQILSDDGRDRIETWLADITSRLIETQHVDGFWEGDWPGTEFDGRAEAKVDSFGTLRLRILVTGHVLEAWALAPEQLLPPREVIHQASQWLTQTIKTMSAAEIREDLTFLTHAGRALAMWRGRFPHECL